MIEDWDVKPIKLQGTPPQVRLEFSHKSTPLVIEHTETVTFTTAEALNEFASRAAKDLDVHRAARIALDALPTGPLTLEEPEEPEEPVKDTDKEAFIEALQLVRKYEKAVDTGLKDGKGGDYTARLDAARADLKSKYKEAYIDLLAGI